MSSAVAFSYCDVQFTLIKKDFFLFIENFLFLTLRLPHSWNLLQWKQQCKEGKQCNQLLARSSNNSIVVSFNRLIKCNLEGSFFVQLRLRRFVIVSDSYMLCNYFFHHKRYKGSSIAIMLILQKVLFFRLVIIKLNLRNMIVLHDLHFQSFFGQAMSQASHLFPGSVV